MLHSSPFNKTVRNLWSCSIFQGIALIALLSFMGLSAAHAQADLSFVPASPTVNIGDNGSLVLQVQAGAQNVDGVEIHLDFNPTLIQITGVTYDATAELPVVISAATFDNGAGTISASSGINLSGGSPASGTFDYLTIDYTAIAAGTADITYDFTFPTSATDISLNSASVLGVTNPASITVNNPAPFQVCVGCGNTAINALGNSFLADNVNAPPAGQPFVRTNGKAFKNYSGAIAGTTPGSDEELLFQKEIYGGAGGGNPSYTYDIPVANGTYQVELYFAEVFHPTAGSRIFDVLLEGNVILDEYDMMDPLKDGLSSNQTAITRTYFINVSDGEVNIQIGPASVDNGKLAGFCVTEVASPNLMPVSAIGNITVDANTAASAPMNISDPENDVLTVTLNGAPPSLSYNPSTGNLEGTPLATEAGTYTVNAIISDGTSSNITEEFILTINPPVGDTPPTIDPIQDLQVSEGGTASTSFNVIDDNNAANVSLVLYDKSVPGINTPFAPGAVVPGTDYSLIDNGGGNHTFSWLTAPGDGRSYYAVVTADDGVNPAVEGTFTVNVGIDPTTTFPARYFANPLPWYGNNPGAGFSIAIETNANENIGFIDNGEFVEYWVDIPAAGTYDFTLAGAKQPAGITTIELSDQTGVIGSVDVVNNGSGWQDYADYTDQVTFANAGLQLIRLDFLGPVNVLELTLSPVAGNSTPIVQISTPNDGDTFTEGDPITFTGTASDIEDGNLDATIAWSSDVDGALGTGASVSSSSLSVGPHVITASATDSDPTTPATGTASISITIQANQAPVVQINSPANSSSFFVGDNISFSGTSTDPEEGNLDAGISWTSSIDGGIGSGASFATNTLSPGSHTITASSTDNNGSNPLTGTATISIDVNQSSPACNVTYRVNAGGALFNDPNGNFEADQADATNGTANGTASTGTPSSYYDNSTIDLTFGTATPIGTNNSGYPDDLFQQERYSTADTMKWDFPVENGVYDVKLLFCEIWTGEVNNPRVFDILIEGQVAEDDYRPSGPTGADYNVAKVETYQANVTDGILQVYFSKETQNPAIKGFDICLVNEAPQVAISAPSNGSSFSQGTQVTFTASATDAEDGSLDASINWSSDLDGSLGTGASINVSVLSLGTHVITASATDGGALTGQDEISVTINASLTPPTVSISSPTLNQAVTRGTAVNLDATANDNEDGDISANIQWSTDDNLATLTPLNGQGSNITGEFVIPGTTTVTASVTDSDSQTGSESVTIDVNSPSVSFTSPTPGSTVNGPTVTMTWTATDVLYGLTEHFHLYVNPDDPNNLDPNDRISTASQIGQTFWDLGPADSILAGQNTVVIVVADQFHQEFADPGATDIVTFNVADVDPPVITLLGANPLVLTVGDPYVEPGATALDDFDGDVSANIVIDASAVDVNTTGSYQVTYDVSDASGNPAIQVIRTVDVIAAPVTDVFLVVNPGSQTVNENTIATAIVQVQANAQTLDGVEVHLVFDATVLQVQSITDLSGTDFPTSILAPTFDNASGTIDFAAGNFGPSFPSGTIDLFSIDFLAVGGPSSGISFTTSSPLSDATFAAASVLSGTTDALVNVIEDPELVITPGSFSVSVGIDGNTTETYVVDVNDASTLPGNAPITIIDDATGLAATWVTTVASAAQGVSETLSFDATGLAPGTYTATMTAGPVSGYDDGLATITMVVQAPPAPGAFIAVTPGGGLGASTFGAGSWQITNTGNIDITSVSIDLSSGILPDMVWDPVGTGGDATAACLTVGVGAAVTGFTAPADPCVDPFSVPRNGGFDVATLSFTDFNQGELFTFASDNDPNSIQGVAGAGAAGAVSGYEMIGATITVNFADGSTLTGSLFEEGTLGGANLTLEPTPPSAPSIELAGFPAQSEIIVTDVNQTVTVSGNPGDIVTLLQMDSRLFIASGDPAFGVSPFDTIFYSNEAMAGKAVFTQTVGAGGTVDIPVTLFQTAGAAGTPSGGKNQFIAVTTPGAYSTTSPSSLTSNVLTVRYFPGYNPAALVEVTPGGALAASTFDNNSFQITNTGTVDIVSVSIDLSTGFLMDVVFDPIGTAGDNGSKCLTPNTVVGTPGYIVTTDPCADPFSVFHNGIDVQDGYDVVNLNFSEFNPGEGFNFSVDQDPTSIKNDITTGDAGSISGAENTGATVTIQFADGTTLTRCLWTDGSDGGSSVELTVDDLPAPSIMMQGFASSPIQTSDINQTIDISGPANASIELLQWDARLYIDAGSPNPYDIDPFEANEVMAKVIYTGTLDASGMLSIPVTLLETPSTNAGPDGGLNHFMAVVTDTGITSCMSNVIIAEVLPFCAVNDLTPVLCEDAAVSVDLTTYQSAITVETGTFAFASGGTPIADPSDVMVSDGQQIDVVFTGANGCVEPSTITFTVHPVDTTNLTATTCDPAMVGVTQQLLANQYGCDSLVVTTTVLTTVSANPGVIACNDNGTPFDLSDDYISFEIAPTGSNLGQGYIVSGDVTAGAFAYTAGTVILNAGAGTPGAGDLTITVTDTASGCSETIIIPDPGACGVPLSLIINEKLGVPGMQVTVPLTVKSFVDQTGGQGTITWDPSIISFVSTGDEAFLISSYNTPISSVNPTSPGVLTFVFFDPLLAGVTLADDDTLFSITFDVIGVPGDTSDVLFSGLPTGLVFNSTTGPVTPVLIDGLVRIPEPAPISGAAYTEPNVGGTSYQVEGVRFTLDGPNNLNQVAGGNAGDFDYTFTVQPGLPYEIGAFKNNDSQFSRGVDVTDIIEIQSHILSLNLLGSPYKIIAADVDADNAITVNDIIQVQELILTIRSSFPRPDNPVLNDRLWAFVSEDLVFANPAFPLPYYPTDTSRIETPLDTTAGYDFVAMKLGDVNTSWTPNPSGLRKEGTPVYFNFAKTIIPDEGIIEIPVTVEDFSSITGYQFTIQWDPAHLEFLNVSGQALPLAQFNDQRSGEGLLSTIWFDPLVQGITLENGEEVFRLKFRVVGSFGDQGSISIGSDLTPEVIADISHNQLHIASSRLSYSLGDAATSLRDEITDGYGFGPGMPNPFTEAVAFRFVLPVSEDVTIEIYNHLGQKVWQSTETFSSGVHKFQWAGTNQSGQPVSEGVYSVRFSAGAYSSDIQVLKVE